MDTERKLLKIALNFIETYLYSNLINDDRARRISERTEKILDEPEWKPMDTAPIDGTWCILKKSGKAYPGYCIIDPDGEKSWALFTFNFMNFYCNDPDGWKPIECIDEPECKPIISAPKDGPEAGYFAFACEFRANKTFIDRIKDNLIWLQKEHSARLVISALEEHKGFYFQCYCGICNKEYPEDGGYYCEKCNVWNCKECRTFHECDEEEQPCLK